MQSGTSGGNFYRPTATSAPANSWYAAGARPTGGGAAQQQQQQQQPSRQSRAQSSNNNNKNNNAGAGTSATTTFRQRCESLVRQIGPKSSWDIGLLLAVAVVVIVVSAVSLALMDQENAVLGRYRAVFRVVRERRLVAARHLPDPELLYEVDESTGEPVPGSGGAARAANLRELRDAAYWLNVALVVIASGVAVVSVAALAIRNLVGPGAPSFD